MTLKTGEMEDLQIVKNAEAFLRMSEKDWNLLMREKVERERGGGEGRKEHTKCLPSAKETTCHLQYSHAFVTGRNG